MWGLRTMPRFNPNGRTCRSPWFMISLRIRLRDEESRRNWTSMPTRFFTPLRCVQNDMMGGAALRLGMTCWGRFGGRRWCGACGMPRFTLYTRRHLLCPPSCHSEEAPLRRISQELDAYGRDSSLRFAAFRMTCGGRYEVGERIPSCQSLTKQWGCRNPSLIRYRSQHDMLIPVRSVSLICQF